MKLSANMIGGRAFFLLAVGLVALGMLVQWGMEGDAPVLGPVVSVPDDGIHESRFPSSDCGHNWFKMILLPGGNKCFVNGQSSKKVDEMVEQDTPGVFDQTLSGESLDVLGDALQRVLWSLGLVP